MAAAQTLADLRLVVRRNLTDPLKVKIDRISSYDGTSNPIDLGKDLPIEPQSDVITVSGTQIARGTAYSIDYDARQVTWIAPLPAAASDIRFQYKESRYSTSQIDLGLNQGRRSLFPTIYKKDIATLNLRNLVRDYNLASTDVNENNMRTMFGEGHMAFKILNARLLRPGNNDQAYVPFRNFEQQGETGIHLVELQQAGTILRLEVAYAFNPLIQPADVCNVPDLAQDLMTEWACYAVADKQEVIRGRIDTANVLQDIFANKAGTMRQTAEDFMLRVERLRRLLNIEPMVIEPRNIPHRFEVGLYG